MKNNSFLQEGISPGSAPSNILDAWVAIEVLSPSTFKDPIDFVRGNDSRKVISIETFLPWPANNDGRTYYQIILGSASMELTTAQLLDKYTDTRPDRPITYAATPLAVVLVDQNGVPVPNGLVVSSYAWGLPKALKNDLRSIGAGWMAAETHLTEGLQQILSVKNRDRNIVPLTHKVIINAFNWIVEKCDLNPSYLIKPSFCISCTSFSKTPRPPELLLLNSLFLNDLIKAKGVFKDGTAPDTLKRYLGVLPPESSTPLLPGHQEIQSILSPSRFPLARWPSKGRHPLVIMQQVAVNLASSQKRGEILAVNGPPGTGKTTLLRDVVASLVTQRACAMAKFNSPRDAFVKSERFVANGGYETTLFKVDSSLKGYEMLVASSNNKAVENVSTELPALDAIATDCVGLRYFKPTADALHDRECWGSIAGVLGRSENRGRFINTFWWDKDSGLLGYLQTVKGNAPKVEEGKAKRLPKIVEDLNPPKTYNEALHKWNTARTNFLEAKKQVETTRDLVESLYRRNRLLPLLLDAYKKIAHHIDERPGFFQRFFYSKTYRQWKTAYLPLSDAFSEASCLAVEASLISKRRSKLFSGAVGLSLWPHSPLNKIKVILDTLNAELKSDLEPRRRHVADDNLFNGGRDHAHSSSAWFTEQEHRQRDRLFEAAIHLHRAFIDAAAEPLKNNLDVAMKILGGNSLGTAKLDELIPDLWSSLFFVVPLLSTTFASVGSMLRHLPRESIGWLLVDEAGQASPQEAVGALMRASKAIVVGDPIQVPPVVTLPDALVRGICESFAIDPARFGAPMASVQTLADKATPWHADFPSPTGTRRVGVPLLVHRRCAEPMFSTSNRIAYGGLMVHSKQSKYSGIGKLIGASAWFDISAPSKNKFCSAAAAFTLQKVEEIAREGYPLDLYVVTPFTEVSQELRTMFQSSSILRKSVPNLYEWTREHIGTIHTLQGRESEVVFFVLGAPNPGQSGARNWAGREPNLLNVAVTRAKEAIYVVGAAELWKTAGCFQHLYADLPIII